MNWKSWRRTGMPRNTLVLWPEKFGHKEPVGKCQCGCGMDAPISKGKSTEFGLMPGFPCRFVRGHQKYHLSVEQIMQDHTSRAKSGCLEWVGDKDREGYGRIKFKGRRMRAHRLIWEHYCGAPESGLVVCHKCDNPSCVEIGHLFIGTPADNRQDCVIKNRNPNGTSSNRAAFSKEQVIQIRKARRRGERVADIAKRFGVARNTISRICNYLSYKDVGDQHEHT
jgi:hypothetical protein